MVSCYKCPFLEGAYFIHLAEIMENYSELAYALALTRVPGVGDILARRLINAAGSAEAVFKETKGLLSKVERLNKHAVEGISQPVDIKAFEEEILRAVEADVQLLYYQDDAYPHRLKFCDDQPLLLFYKGNADLNHDRIISVVGTRSATLYSKEVVHQLMEVLKVYDPLVVSGLAFGVDITAHQYALDTGMKTVGVMGHGLDRVYPAIHKPVVEQMIEQGGVLTEFLEGSRPDRENFPKRNRIVAGLSDAVIVVESSMKGGSMITADLAMSYNRDLFAYPGKAIDPFSAGCNWLIKTQKAIMMEEASDLIYHMGWDVVTGNTVQQKSLFPELSHEEERIVGLLQENHELGVDDISLEMKLPVSETTIMLLELEFKAVVKSLPGKKYALL